MPITIFTIDPQGSLFCATRTQFTPSYSISFIIGSILISKLISPCLPLFFPCFYSSSLRVSRWLVYSSASLHLFIGRPRFLFPSGIPSCTFLTSRSSAILDTCSLHSVLLLCIQDVMFWISHSYRILSFRILSHFALFTILLNVFISVTSSNCLVFAMSVHVSAA